MLPGTPLGQTGGQTKAAAKQQKKLKGASAEGKQTPPSAQQLDSEPCSSTGTTHEVVDDDMIEDTRGFKLVSHKKKRKNIPVVIRPTNGGDLRTTNPIKQHEELLQATGEKYTKRRYSAKGCLTIEVPNEEAVSKLLAVSELSGISVAATIPLQYMANTALIKGVDLWHTEESLLEYLRDQGVQRVRRRKRRTGHGPDSLRPCREVVVYFPDNTERPDRLTMGYVSHRLYDHVESPPRCFNCQRFGHLANFCQKKMPTCGRCAGQHKWAECPDGTAPKCANCRKQETANHSDCTSRIDALKRARLFAYGKSAQLKPRGGDQRSKQQPNEARKTGDQSEKAPESQGPNNNKRRRPLTFRNAVLGINETETNNTAAVTPETLQALEKEQQEELERLQQNHQRQKEQLRAQLQARATKQPESARASTTNTQSALQAKVTALEGIVALLASALREVATELPPGPQHSTLQALIALDAARSCSQAEVAQEPNHGH